MPDLLNNLKPIVLCALLPGFAMAQVATATNENKSVEEVQVVLDQLAQNNLKGGTEAATMVMVLNADEFLRIPANGALLTRTDIIDGFKSGKIKVDELVLSDVKIQVFGDSALVTGVQTSKSTVLGTSYDGKIRWARMFIKRDGRWQCVLFQSTKMAP
jgi:ketosteroid isomerase-like protein